MRRGALALAATALLLGACNNRAEASDDDAESNPHYYDDTEKGGETYPEFDERRDDLEGSAGSYEGYGCTEDCSGHDAGYQWADEHGISDPDDCGGKSWSFEEGCRAYAEEQSDEGDEPAE